MHVSVSTALYYPVVVGPDQGVEVEHNVFFRIGRLALNLAARHQAVLLILNMARMLPQACKHTLSSIQTRKHSRQAPQRMLEHPCPRLAHT